MDDTTKTPEQETINEQENVVMNDDGYIASGGKIEEVDLTNKMKDSYINYAMSVIVSRAIPEIDGNCVVEPFLLHIVDCIVSGSDVVLLEHGQIEVVHGIPSCDRSTGKV